MEPAGTVAGERAPAPPAVAQALLGDRLPALLPYAALLVDEGVRWGLLGPREPARLWERHLLNCAVVETMVPPDVRLLDIGSGAGLPGLVLALVRPDLEVVVVDSLLRRVRFLEYAVDVLGLSGRVTVLRARAEELPSRWCSPVATARAVAPLARLAGWCLPLLAGGGELLALRGALAREELRADEAALRALGVRHAEVVRCGEGLLAEPTTVVRLRRTA